MKKQYVKPNIFFESFSLSETIASGCEGIAHFGDIMSCSVTVDFFGSSRNVFNPEGICEWSGVGEDVVCYHAPSDNSNVFSS